MGQKHNNFGGSLVSKALEIAPGVVRIPLGIVNCYAVECGRYWVLVDTGTEGRADQICEVAERFFGRDRVPEAILLTHGHPDHAGSAAELADLWDVPIYAHRLELPYITGESQYPPPDPTVGGFMSLMIRFFPHKTYDLGGRVRELSDRLPAMRGWELIETPGHTPGHVCFFRTKDRVLLAGDALTTINQDSAVDMLRHKAQICRPPAFYTIDWESAEQSVKELADLQPRLVAAGHGIPISGRAATEQLQELAANFPVPADGRYVREPARADEHGITYLPEPVADPLPKVAAGIGVAVIGTLAAWLTFRKRRPGGNSFRDAA
jgi:glyoxylase-like metal-dependent hydrolase (beta-lactamase superfamily II)